MKKKLTFRNLKLFIFFLYNLTYVLYMAGYINRVINLVILSIFIIVCLYEYLNKIIRKKQKVTFGKEFKSAMIIVVAFFIISLIIQVIHKDFELYVISELLYNIIPPVLTFFWINTINEEDVMPYFYIFFIRSITYFLLKNANDLSISSIMQIDWNNSKSSIFESPLAHDFLFLEIIFLYTKKQKLALISMFFCLLSFKRISFILSILVYIGYIFLNKRKKINDILNKEVGKFVIIMTFFVMSISPLILNWIVSDSGISYFSKNGIDINDFTTGRVGIIRYLRGHMKYYNGYGSTDNYLTNSTYGNLSNLGSMHCDMLKLYYEVTELGVLIFIYEMLKIFKKKYITYCMLLYLFLELISSHFLDQLSVWNMFFMFTAYLYKKDEKGIKNE